MPGLDGFEPLTSGSQVNCFTSVLPSLALYPKTLMPFILVPEVDGHTLFIKLLKNVLLKVLKF
jgi:hypothetical protein